MLNNLGDDPRDAWVWYIVFETFNNKKHMMLNEETEISPSKLKKKKTI